VHSPLRINTYLTACTTGLQTSIMAPTTRSVTRDELAQQNADNTPARGPATLKTSTANGRVTKTAPIAENQPSWQSKSAFESARRRRRPSPTGTTRRERRFGFSSKKTRPALLSNDKNLCLQAWYRALREAVIRTPVPPTSEYRHPCPPP
jgi:hypothetical protein